MLIPVEAMPEEFVLGFEGRVMNVNVTHNRRALFSAIARRFALAPNASRVELLAAASLTELPAFCRNHTILPFSRFAVSDTGSRLPHGLPEDRTVHQQRALKPGHTQAKFCRDCANEDKRDHSFSYWRRAHQIHGVERCPTHGTPLSLTTMQFAYEYMPAEHCNSALDLEASKFDECPALQRYAEIACHTLTLTQPLLASRLGSLLGEQARRRGLRTTESGPRPLLSEIALDMLPMAWIEQHYPSITRKRGRAFSATLDSACRAVGHCKPVSFALALALIFDTADAAIQFLTDAVERDGERPDEKMVS